MTVTWTQAGSYSWDSLTTWNALIPGQAMFGGSGTVLVEVAFGADLTASPTTWVWIDVTADVLYSDKLNISQGRSDESSQATPASFNFTLLNTAGNYTPYSPNGTYYPNVKRNTPVRASFDTGTGTHVLFYGYAVGFTPQWSQTASKATVVVSAGGSLRRLAQKKSPLRSSSRRVLDGTSPFAYWPLEDESTARNGASAISNRPDLKLITTPTVGFGADGPAGSVSAVDCSGGGTLYATLTSSTVTVPWRASLFFKKTDASTAYLIGLPLTDGSVFYLKVDSTNVGFYLDNGTTPVTKTYAIGSSVADSAWHSLVVVYYQNGSTVGCKIWIDDVLVANETDVFTGAATARGIKNVYVNRNPLAGVSTFAVAHLALWASTSAALNLHNAISGYAGETVSARLTRVCAENGVSLTLTGSSVDTMGAQPIDSFINVLRDCESTDGGVLYDGFTAGIGYICRSSRYNLTASLTADMSANQVAIPFAPVDDDQRSTNDVTVSREGGSSGRFTDVTGPLGTNRIDTYDAELTVNTQTDDPLVNIAAWNVHLGTVEGLRYPYFAFDFVANPTLIASWIATTLSFRLDVTNVTSTAIQHPPNTITTIVEGYTMTIDLATWTVSANCSPYQPWAVAKIGDATNPWRIDSDNSTLTAGINTSAVSFSVNSVNAWTTTAAYPADFPFDINIGGERITVTGITSIAKDAFGRSVSNDWGTSDTGGAYSCSGGSASDFNVAGGVGKILLSSVNVSRYSVLSGLTLTDSQSVVTVNVPAISTGSGVRADILARYTNSNSNYQFVLRFETDSSVTAFLIKNVNGTTTTLVSGTIPGVTYTAGQNWNIRAYCVGTTLQVKGWPTASPEPTMWTLSTTDSDLTSGSPAIRAAANAGNTNVSSVFTFDNFEVYTPQAFTATRSVNGIVKAHSAGDSVTLFQPAAIAL